MCASPHKGPCGERCKRPRPPGRKRMRVRRRGLHAHADAFETRPEPGRRTRRTPAGPARVPRARCLEGERPAAAVGQRDSQKRVSMPIRARNCERELDCASGPITPLIHACAPALPPAYWYTVSTYADVRLDSAYCAAAVT
ncbi:Uncharacterised protein [Burkholderia pseudomallei]|nr:Uncharacterised protein [Burkholderia pseudomallei]CAJ7391496.1 Uncharacterised protein [Burkholderia pseudomallei]